MAIKISGTTVIDDSRNLVNIDAATVSSINGGPLAGMRNRIINGDMRIDQRNGGAAITPTSSSYTADRWQLQVTQASKLTVQQITSQASGPVGFPNYLGSTSTSSYSVLSSDFFALVQKVEAFNVSDLAWGTASAQTVTLSFKVWCTLSGTFGGSITNSAGDRSYPFVYSVPSANTWTNISITIPGDVSGTWDVASSALGLVIYISLGAGSTYRGTAGSWAAGNFVTATGATSVVGTNGATLYITGVQIEAGPVATPFERRPIGTELALCQRYYYQSTTNSTTKRRWAGSTAASYLAHEFSFPVTMRAAPTIGTTTTPVLTNCSTLATTMITTDAVAWTVTSTVAGGVISASWTATTADAEF